MKPAPFWVAPTASAIRRLPFGRYHVSNTIARFAGGPFLARMPGDLGGARFVCDLHDTIAREVCFTGRYEPQETQLAMQLLGQGMTVVDVGANWGYFTLVTAYLVGPRGRVLALEPHPRLSWMLRENVSVNALTHVEPLTLAAGAEAGPRTFIAFDERGGNSGLSRAASLSETGDFDCATIALDALVDARKIGRVDLLKMDIEGGEVDALRGMTAGLAAHRYRYVLLECHPAALAAAGACLDHCLAPFARAGYRGWRIDHSPPMHKRAASGLVPAAELLSPIDPVALRSDPWPHLLWVAPGEPLPA
jgi:FkbM family methyltransferase